MRPAPTVVATPPFAAHEFADFAIEADVVGAQAIVGSDTLGPRFIAPVPLACTRLMAAPFGGSKSASRRICFVAVLAILNHLYHQKAQKEQVQSCQHTTTLKNCTPFERSSKRRKGFPSETHVKRGHRIVHGDKELTEKLGRNDICPCGSGRRFQKMLSGKRRI